MNTLFRSLRNAAEKIGLVESFPYGRTVCKTWRIGDAFTEKVLEGTVRFTLKYIYYKDDYECGYDLKRGCTMLAVKYEVEVLQAERLVPAGFLDLYLEDGDETDCEILTYSLRQDLEYTGVNNRSLLGKGESMEIVCAYLVPKKTITRKESVILFPLQDEEEGAGEALETTFVIPLECAEDLTGRSVR